MGTFKMLRGDYVFSAYVGATAAGTAVEVPVIRAPHNMLVTAVYWVPGAAMTANGTNYCTLTLRNRGTGAGTVTMGTRAWSATNSVATTPEAITLSSTATDLQVASGDTVTAHFTHTASGLAVPAGIVQFSFRTR